MNYGESDDQKTQLVLKKYAIAKYIVDSVHGSGINYDWYAEETPSFIKLYNRYDLMDEAGYYTYVIDFAVVIPKKNPLEFKIQYLDNQSRYQASRNAMTEYLGDVFGYEINEYLKKRARSIKNIKKTHRKVKKK